MKRHQGSWLAMGVSAFFAVILFLSGCQKSGGNENVGFSNGSNIDVPQFGQGTPPPSTQLTKLGPSNTASTFLPPGSDKSQDALPTTKSVEQLGQGETPLSFPDNWNFTPLLRQTSRLRLLEPRMLPNPKIFNIYYCWLRERVPNYLRDKVPYIWSFMVDLFGRKATVDEEVAYVNKLPNPHHQPTRYNVIWEILTTNEEYLRREVRALYVSILERMPGENANYFEGQGWVNHLRAGHTEEDTLANFLASDEFFAKTGSHPIGWVDNVYRKVLGRPCLGPDWPGHCYWWAAQGTANWAQRKNIALGIIKSHESIQKFVEMLYLTLLRRQGEPAGIQHWVGQMLHHNMDRRTARANFLASDEYYNRSKERFAGLFEDNFCSTLSSSVFGELD